MARDGPALRRSSSTGGCHDLETPSRRVRARPRRSAVVYQFIVRRGPNFSFAWHNTTGPLKEGVGSDPGLPSPVIGAQLFSIMESLPRTSIELGSIVSLGFATNGVRDAILYQQHLRPLIYIPLHVTDVAVPSSSPEFKKSYLQTLDTAQVSYRPELRWLVDPNDFCAADGVRPR